jgi:hypothetical protein
VALGVNKKRIPIRAADHVQTLRLPRLQSPLAGDLFSTIPEQLSHTLALTTLGAKEEQCGHLSLGWSQQDPHDEGLLGKDHEQTSNTSR